jgi:hypothetical protein
MAARAVSGKPDVVNKCRNGCGQRHQLQCSPDVYFGPAAPTGKASNWVPTDPKRGFERAFCAYTPTKVFFDKTWKLSDVEKMN